MRLLKWIRGKGGESDDARCQRFNLAFVLLSEPKLPDIHAVVRAFASFASPGESLEVEPEGVSDSTERTVLSLRHSSGDSCLIAHMAVPIPNREADSGARFSLSSFRDGWTLPSHCAHLVVTLHNGSRAMPIASVSRFTSILAAVAEVSPSVGIYWAGSGATHDSEFFISVAKDEGIIPRIMLWTGVSIAREPDGRLSLLSLGMNQLSLPNLLLVSGPQTEGSAVETMFDLLAYVVDRGEPIPEGETIGMSAEQRLPVRYVTSPVEPTVKVWRVEFP